MKQQVLLLGGSVWAAILWHDVAVDSRENGRLAHALLSQIVSLLFWVAAAYQVMHP